MEKRNVPANIETMIRSTDIVSYDLPEFALKHTGTKKMRGCKIGENQESDIS